MTRPSSVFGISKCFVIRKTVQRKKDVYTLAGPHPSLNARVGKTAQSIREGTRCIDKRTSANCEPLVRDLIFHRCRRQLTIRSLFEPDYFRVVQGLASAPGESMNECDVVSGVVKLPVRIDDRPLQPLTSQRRKTIDCLRAGNVSAREQAGAPRHPVVDLHSDAVIKHIEPTEAGDEKFQRTREERRVL